MVRHRGAERCGVPAGLGIDPADGNSGGIVQTVWPFAATLVAFAAFIVAELRVPAPMVDLSLFRNRSYAGAAGSVFLLSAMLVGFIFFLTLYLQNALGFDALQTGVRLLPMMALVGFSAPIAGRLSRRPVQRCSSRAAWRARPRARILLR